MRFFPDHLQWPIPIGKIPGLVRACGMQMSEANVQFHAWI
jgi:hypothetical protein